MLSKKGTRPAVFSHRHQISTQMVSERNRRVTEKSDNPRKKSRQICNRGEKAQTHAKKQTSLTAPVTWILADFQATLKITTTNSTFVYSPTADLSAENCGGGLEGTTTVAAVSSLLLLAAQASLTIAFPSTAADVILQSDDGAQNDSPGKGNRGRINDGISPPPPVFSSRELPRNVCVERRKIVFRHLH